MAKILVVSDTHGDDTWLNLIKDNKDYIDDVKDACARYHLDSDEAMLLLTLLKNHVAFDLHLKLLIHVLYLQTL